MASLAALSFEPDVVSIETLDRKIVALNRTLTATEYELLVLIRAFDERSGWLKWGSANCAEWLHWRCDLSLSAAREKVRVAHALKVLPLISQAFSEGRLSYSKVRALTRVADRNSEGTLLEFALSVSAAVVEQRCQQIRNASEESQSLSAKAYSGRGLRASRNVARGVMTLTVELPLADGELVLNALDRVLAADPEAPDNEPSYRARQADALIALCRSVLSGEVGPARSGEAAGTTVAQPPLSRTADAYQVVVHVDACALGGVGGERSTQNHPSAEASMCEAPSTRPPPRADLPISTIRRLTCDGTLVPILDAPDGSPLNVGRKRRTVSTALKRAVLARDRHCRFPGCTRSRFVDAHHVRHWADGGETTLENLMLLCDHHHRLVHEGGFHIFVDHTGERCFRRPDGRVVPACGYRMEDTVDTPDTVDTQDTPDTS